MKNKCFVTGRKVQVTGVLLLYLFTFLPLMAQKLDRRQRRMRMDSVLTVRYYRTSYDTNYVVRPEGRLTVKARLLHGT